MEKNWEYNDTGSKERSSSDRTAELASLPHLWKLSRKIDKTVDRMATFLLPNKELGSIGKIAQQQLEINENTKHRKKTTTVKNMIHGGSLVLNFIFAMLVLYLQLKSK